MTSKAISRAMTAPTLSISIPPVTVTSNGPSTKWVIKNGNVVPQDEQSDESSDASSICHSPGWGDLSGKKRKKEKREKARQKQEREKVNKEQKVKTRLMKPPPISSSPGRISISIDRPTPSEVQLTPETREIVDDNKKSSEYRSRRRSIEVGLKSLISATHPLQIPWKSLNPTSRQIPPAQDVLPVTKLPSKPSGFIGGLKLRRTEQASAEDSIRKQWTSQRGDSSKTLLDDRGPTIGNTVNTSSSASLAESNRPATSIYEESTRTPQQWESIYAQAANLARNDAIKNIENIPIMERNIKKSRKTYPPISRHFPLSSDPDSSSSSQRDSSIASTARITTASRFTRGDRNNEQRPSTDDRGNSTEGSEISKKNRFRSSGYVTHQRRQSEDQALAGFRDQDMVADATRKSRSRGSSFSFRRSRSHVGSSTEDVPSLAKPVPKKTLDKTQSKDPNNTISFSNQDYKAPELEGISPNQNSSPHTEKASESAINLKSLTTTAKSTFSKQPAALESPTGSFYSATEILVATYARPVLSKRGATTELFGDKESMPTKDEQNSGEFATPATMDFAKKPPSSDNVSTISNFEATRHDGTSRSLEMPISKLNVINGKPNSRSVTDSSEDYLDEVSNSKTPTTSRSQSWKEYHNNGKIKQPEPFSGKASKSGHREALMTGGLPFDDAASGHETWARTALPMELTEDEERMKTPVDKKSVPDFTTSYSNQPETNLNTSKALPDEPSYVPDIKRQHSISRSISTPELQDLSFLPELKHQALTRPQKGKSRGSSSKKSRQAYPPGEKAQKDIRRPAPISIGSTKSEGSSPTSPKPSQYLQTARLNMPRQSGPRSPSFSHSKSTHPIPGAPDPVAKMFVVCCSCKYFHDMPSKIYQCMAKPDNVVEDRTLGVSGVISTSVKCPWCGHGMSTTCCAGYAAVVYLREKLH